jgi:glycosyltransferase involved in cell wall biosynthesis
MRPTRPAARVLVVGPAGGTRGGIDSVVSAHASSPMWQENRCELIKTYVDRGPFGKIWAALKAYAAAALKTPSARLVHIHLAGEVSLMRKLPFVALAKLFRKRTIVHVHAGSPESLFDKTPSWAVRFVMLSADRVIALSPKWAENIQQHFPAAKVTVIPNPAVIPAPQGSVDYREPIVLFMGKLEQRKGYSDLIKAAKEILEVVPDARFQFAGHGEVDQARQLAKALGIPHTIECLGWVARDRMPNLLNRAAVFCLPTYNEGVPMAMLEAMSYGLPVVTTPVGGIPDVIQNHANGILFEPGDVKALAHEITRLLRNDNSLRSSLGDAGRATVNALCGLEKVTGLLSTLYAELAPISSGADVSSSLLPDHEHFRS